MPLPKAKKAPAGTETEATVVTDLEAGDVILHDGKLRGFARFYPEHRGNGPFVWFTDGTYVKVEDEQTLEKVVE